MTIHLSIDAVDVPDLRRICAELAQSGAPAPIVEAATVADPMAAARAAKAAKNSKKAAEVATPSAEAAQPAGNKTDETVSPPASAELVPAGASLPSHEDMTAKLRELSASKGMPTVSAILKEFTAKDSAKKVERIKEVNPADYAAIIAKVDAALKG